MSQNLKVCLFPQQIVWGNKTANLDYLERALKLVHPETDLVVMPEMFSTGFLTGDKEKIRGYAEWNSGETVELLKRLSSEYNVALAGSFIADTGGLLFNRAFFIEPNGDCEFADKRHLFSMAGENKVFKGGNSRLKVRYRGWNIAMIVCYDIRFPVWCRNVSNEYDLLLAVANWPKARVGAWNQLLLARAIENEAYVCGVNCLGIDDHGYEYDGSSMAVDFKGKDISVIQTVEMISSCQESQQATVQPFIYATLSLEKLDAFREKFPAWKDADAFRILE